MVEQPLISVLIPTCHRPESLRKAVRTALGQPHVQVCIYDNSTDDTTQQMLKIHFSGEERIVYRRHATPLTAAENFDFALRHVTTPLFAFLADDDYLLPGFYKKGLEALAIHPEAQFFLGSTINVNTKGWIRNIPANYWPSQPLFQPMEAVPLCLRHYINWIGALFRTEIRDQVGTIDTRVTMIDLDFMLRSMASVPFVFSKTPCALFVEHSQSQSGGGGLSLVWPSWAHIEQNLLAITGENVSIQYELRTSLTKHLRHLLVRALAVKHGEEANAILALREGNDRSHSWVVRAITHSNILRKMVLFLVGCRRTLRTVGISLIHLPTEISVLRALKL